MISDSPLLRPAAAADLPEVLDLWSALFAEDVPDSNTWSANAEEWFLHSVDRREDVTLPVIEVAGQLVATAVGLLTIGVPNPWSPRGRGVRLENVYTRPDQRGLGFGTQLVLAVIGWATEIGADRVDLSTTPLGRRIYERAGFVETSAPRMKLVL